MVLRVWHTTNNISWSIPITQIKTRDWNVTNVRYFILNTYVPFLAKPQKRTHIKNFAIEILYMTCHFIPVAISYTRHAHFSHFSRQREMVLRDISREKCGREKLREKSTIFGQFWAQFDQKLIFQVKLLPCELKLLYQMILLDFFDVVLRFIAYFDLTKKLSEKINQI